MTSKQAIVTGAFGFLGRNVARVFADNGYIVTGLGHGTWIRSEWLKWGLSDWHCCDITMDSLIQYAQNPHVIIHCAGSGSVGYSMTHPMQDFERTVSTTLSVLEYIRLYSGNTSFIYPSSAAVYGNAERLPITENSSLHPISPYGVHKKIGEELCQLYGKQFLVPVLIIRFFSLYGIPLRKQLLWDTCIKVMNNDLNFYGTGKELRDWLHVTDAAKMMHMLSSKASESAPIFNGGSGVGTSVHTVIDLVQKYMNKTGVPVYSHNAKPGDPPGYIADMKRVSDLLWSPEIKIENGIHEYVRWYRSGFS